MPSTRSLAIVGFLVGFVPLVLLTAMSQLVVVRTDTTEVETDDVVRGWPFQFQHGYSSKYPYIEMREAETKPRLFIANVAISLAIGIAGGVLFARWAATRFHGWQGTTVVVALATLFSYVLRPLAPWELSPVHAVTTQLACVCALVAFFELTRFVLARLP